jgi:hypothetical protein
MKYFKDAQGKPYAYEDDADDSQIQEGLISISKAAFDLLLIPTPPTISESQSKRCAELRVDCEKAIIGSFSSSALGSAHSYDNRRDDQSNLRLRQAVSTIDTLPRNTAAHDGAELTRASHTTAQLNQVMIDMEAHLESKQAKLASLIAQVNAVSTGNNAEDAITIAAIVW